MILTLKECIEHAFENNLELKQYHNDIVYADLQVKQSTFEYFPTAHAEINHYLNSGRSLNYETYSWENEKIQQGNLGISVNTILFQGLYKLYNRKSKLLQSEATQLNLEKQKLLLGIEITKSYHNAQLFITNMNILQNSIDQSRSAIDNLREEILAGVKPTIDLYELEAQMHREVSELNAIMSGYSRELAYLKVLINWEENFTVTPHVFQDTILRIKQPANINIDPVIDDVVHSSVFLKQEKVKTKQSEFELKMSKALFSPKISTSAVLSSRYLRNAVNPLSEIDDYPYYDQIKDNQYKQVVFTISIPIYDHNKRNTSLKIKELAIQESKNQEELVVQELRNELKIIKNELDYLERKIRNTNQMKSAYSKSFQAAQEKYKGGILDSYSLNIAKNNYLRSKLELNKLRIEFNMNIEVLTLYSQFSEN